MTLVTSPAAVATFRLRSAEEVQHESSASTDLPLNPPHHVAYVEYDAEELAATFHALAKVWEAETGMLSSAQTRVMHPAYQRTIGLGPAVLPLILRQLAEQPDHWFWALHAITGEDVAPNNTNLAEVCAAWLQWGKEREYFIGQGRVVCVEYDAEELTVTFRTLADKWWNATAILSFIQRKVMHPAYQRIIGLGPAVLPLILKELAERPSHWFWALQSITGENPVSEEANAVGAREAWLQWGRERGYLT